MLVNAAYRFPPERIVGAPKWYDTQFFDIDLVERFRRHTLSRGRWRFTRSCSHVVMEGSVRVFVRREMSASSVPRQSWIFLLPVFRRLVSGLGVESIAA